MPSNQRSQSAPPGVRNANTGPENVQSNWSRSSGPSQNAGDATAQTPHSGTGLNTPVARENLGQGSNHTVASHGTGGSDGDNLWIRKTLLTFGM